MPDVAPSPENIGRGASLRNQVQKPPGILPKNAQTWVIAGLSVVMIAAIAISGNGSKKNSSAVHPARHRMDPNAARITGYGNRLEEETQRLAAEQAQLNQAKRAVGVDQHPIAGAGAPPRDRALHAGRHKIFPTTASASSGSLKPKKHVRNTHQSWLLVSP